MSEQATTHPGDAVRDKHIVDELIEERYSRLMGLGQFKERGG